MKRQLLFHSLSIFFCLLFLVSCMVENSTLQPERTEPPQATPTFINTPTFVWFPPTATYIPLPTTVVTPTVEIKPDVGKLLFSDSFDNPNDWSLNQSANSGIALGQNEISLAISQPDLYLYTLRTSPILENFYLEITASPGICIGEDEYGVLFRMTPDLGFYRLALTCNGQIRLDRYHKGQASSPQPKIFSGAVPPGAPSSSRLAIWASGRNIIVFVNDQYQFTIRDPSLESGSIGLFVRTSDHSSLSVSFSDLFVYEVVE